MLKSCGVIVEYNPFHTGHKYHLEEARKQSGADVIIAVMSGNFLQRGEPAIVDKWERANAALKNGADLVIELPFAYSVQSADYFASGAIKLLQSLNVDSLCFGTDSTETLDYEKFARFNQDYSDELQQEFEKLKSEGLSYPQQMTKVYQKLYPNWPLNEHSPNHILGMSYAKANQQYSKPMRLYPIKRQGSGYHDSELSTTNYASATAIRQQLKSDEQSPVEQFVPEEMIHSLKNHPLIDWSTAWPFLKYQLVKLSVEELGNIYQMSEGIEYRLKDKIKQADSFENFVELVKNKRFTWTRLQRLVTYILLGVTEEEINSVRKNPYLRVLGFNQQGRAYLSQEKDDLKLPVITNINQKNEELLKLDIRAGEIYQLLGKQITNQDYQRKPIVL